MNKCYFDESVKDGLTNGPTDQETHTHRDAKSKNWSSIIKQLLRRDEHQ